MSNNQSYISTNLPFNGYELNIKDCFVALIVVVISTQWWQWGQRCKEEPNWDTSIFYHQQSFIDWRTLTWSQWVTKRQNYSKIEIGMSNKLYQNPSLTKIHTQRILSFGLQWCVVHCKSADISEEHTTCNFRFEV